MTVTLQRTLRAHEYRALGTVAIRRTRQPLPRRAPAGRRRRRSAHRRPRPRAPPPHAPESRRPPRARRVRLRPNPGLRACEEGSRPLHAHRRGPRGARPPAMPDPHDASWTLRGLATPDPLLPHALLGVQEVKDPYKQHREDRKAKKTQSVDLPDHLYKAGATVALPTGDHVRIDRLNRRADFLDESALHVTLRLAVDEAPQIRLTGGGLDWRPAPPDGLQTEADAAAALLQLLTGIGRQRDWDAARERLLVSFDAVQDDAQALGSFKADLPLPSPDLDGFGPSTPPSCVTCLWPRARRRTLRLGLTGCSGATSKVTYTTRPPTPCCSRRCAHIPASQMRRYLTVPCSPPRSARRTHRCPLLAPAGPARLDALILFRFLSRPVDPFPMTITRTLTHDRRSEPLGDLWHVGSLTKTPSEASKRSAPVSGSPAPTNASSRPSSTTSAKPARRSSS